MNLTNLSKLELNKAYEAKLSWKRKENYELRSQIKEFIETNFEITMPKTLNEFKRWVNIHSIYHETYNFIWEDYGQLIKAYYALGFFGQSVASLFEDGKGHFATYTNGHLYSKHRIDPVWNWKKSKIIRSSYLKFFTENPQVMENYSPTHITLTLPHPEGKYNGEDFYAKQLIEKFNLLRKGTLWQKNVYAGEYGIEVTASKTGNGLHIHLHSLVFLKCKHLKAFREKLQQQWEKQTGASQIWVESLFVYKKSESGKFINEIRPSKKLLTEETDEGDYMSSCDGEVILRKKYYLSDEIACLKKEFDGEELQQKKTDVYLRAILECIKYHFKNDSLMLDGKNYNITLINEVLKNTKGKRLYSRFGAFYNEKTLNFNHLDKAENKSEEEPEEDSGDMDVRLNQSNDTVAINPFTNEEVPISETQLVIFYPESLNYSAKTNKKPNSVLNNRKDVYERIDVTSTKMAIRMLFARSFPNKTKKLKNLKC